MESVERFIAITSEDEVLVVGGTSGAGAAVSGTAEVSLQLATPNAAPGANRRRKLLLHRVDVMRKTGASATNFQVQVYNSAGAATTAYATKYLGAATAPGTRYDETNISAPMHTDTDGKVYVKINGDAADTFDFAVWFKVIS